MPITQLPSNYTPREILRAVRHQYPNLSGPLLDMYNLLYNELPTIEEGEQWIDELNAPRTCEHCGSLVEHKHAR